MTVPKKPTGIPPFVGEHIRALRLEKGFSLHTFHKAGGPTQSTMSALENGKNGFEVETLLQIARTLGVLPSALLPDELFDEPQTPKKPG